MAQKKYYAGIGRLVIPDNIHATLLDLGYLYASQGWILRTGGAKGADTAFEQGAIRYAHKHSLPLSKVIEIYLPKQHSNQRNTDDDGYYLCSEAITAHSLQNQINSLIASWHPTPRRLGKTQPYMEANCLQILGSDLKTLSSHVICWTHDGNANTGGTGFAKRLADHYDIKVWDLFYPEVRAAMANFIALHSPALNRLK